MSQKYVIAHFIQPLEPGYNFSSKEWPLHITLLPNFIVSGPLNELINNLGVIARSTTPFNVQAGEDANFGPNGDVLVTLIKPEAAILSLHKSMLEITKSYIFDSPQYIGQGYRPHSAKQVDSQLRNGESHRIDCITLVDMYPNNDIQRREVIKTFFF